MVLLQAASSVWFFNGSQGASLSPLPQLAGYRLKCQRPFQRNQIYMTLKIRKRKKIKKVHTAEATVELPLTLPLLLFPTFCFCAPCRIQVLCVPHVHLNLDLISRAIVSFSLAVYWETSGEFERSMVPVRLLLLVLLRTTEISSENPNKQNYCKKKLQDNSQNKDKHTTSLKL